MRIVLLKSHIVYTLENVNSIHAVNHIILGIYLDILVNNMAYTSGKLKLLPLFSSINIILLSGCTTAKPMHDPSTYSGMNCQQLIQEQQAVSGNAQDSRKTGSFGFLDILGAVSEGLALGAGQTAAAQQQHESNAQYNDYRDKKTSEADAFDKRTELLNKIITMRKCV